MAHQEIFRLQTVNYENNISRMFTKQSRVGEFNVKNNENKLQL